MRLTNAVNPRVFVVNAKLIGTLSPGVEPYLQQTGIEIKDLTNDPSVKDGVSLMNALITKSRITEVKEALSRNLRVYDQFRVIY